MIGNRDYSFFACLFIVIIAGANFVAGLCAHFVGEAYQPVPSFPPEPLLGSDFQGFTYMAMRVRHGLPLYEERDYGDPRQAELDRRYRMLFGPTQGEIADWYIRVHMLPWNHPPLVAYLAMPFTWIPRPWMYRILLGLLLASLFGTLLLLGRYSRERAIFWMVAAALVAFSYPLMFALERGGIDMFALLLVTLGFALWSDMGHRLLAGLCFALAIQMKLYPLLFLYYFLIKKEWRICIAILAWSIVLMAACAFACREGVAAGFSQYAKLSRFLRSDFVFNSVCYFAGNHSTYNFLRALCAREDVSLALLLRAAGIVNFALLGAVSAAILVRRAVDSVGRLLDFSLIMLVMTITPPEANDYTLVFLYFVFLSCFVCFERIDFANMRTRILFILFGVNAILLFMPTMTPPFWQPPYGYAEGLWLLSNKWPLLITLLVIVFLVRREALSPARRERGGCLCIQPV